MHSHLAIMHAQLAIIHILHQHEHSKNRRVTLTQVRLSQVQLIWPTTNGATASLL